MTGAVAALPARQMIVETASEAEKWWWPNPTGLTYTIRQQHLSRCGRNVEDRDAVEVRRLFSVVTFDSPTLDLFDE